MDQDQHSPSAQTDSNQRRRDFLSLSFLAGSGWLLAAETRGQSPLTQNDDLAITRTVGIADSIVLYTNLLEDVRRAVLQNNAQEIYVAKFEATEWLRHTTGDAERLRTMLTEGAALTDQQKAELRRFLSEVNYGGNEISRGLIRMRQEPLQKIKNLDSEFDKIRAQLTAASNALKNRNPALAREGLAAAIGKVQNYSDARADPGRIYEDNTIPPGGGQAQGRPPGPEQQRQINRPVPYAPSTLRELLQTLLDLLNATENTPPADHNHSQRYAAGFNYASFAGAPALQTGINAVLRSRLSPASWLQVGIGYAVAFPILLRVSDKNNRLKLLNDALRLVPPGLRNPQLAELASELANLP